MIWFLGADEFSGFSDMNATPKHVLLIIRRILNIDTEQLRICQFLGCGCLQIQNLSGRRGDAYVTIALQSGCELDCTSCLPLGCFKILLKERKMYISGNLISRSHRGC
jgi:hypothetical protein